MLSYSKVVNLLIRPPRSAYRVDQLPGPKLSLQGKHGLREDLELKTRASGAKLKCSLFMPGSTSGPVPCVCYCHGNSGNRLEAVDVMAALLIKGVAVFTFDFLGCGQSDGDFVTLGVGEQEDVQTVMAHLKRDHRIGPIALWGRSMGGVAALLWTAKHPNDAVALVVDSAFASLDRLIQEVAETQFGLGTTMTKMVFKLINWSIKKRTGYSLSKLDVAAAAKQCTVPVLLGCANADTLISPLHSDLLYTAYGGAQKQLVNFEGDHNSQHHVLTFRARDLLTAIFKMHRRTSAPDHVPPNALGFGLPPSLPQQQQFQISPPSLPQQQQFQISPPQTLPTPQQWTASATWAGTTPPSQADGAAAADPSDERLTRTERREIIRTMRTKRRSSSAGDADVGEEDPSLLQKAHRSPQSSLDSETAAWAAAADGTRRTPDFAQRPSEVEAEAARRAHRLSLPYEPPPGASAPFTIQLPPGGPGGAGGAFVGGAATATVVGALPGAQGSYPASGTPPQGFRPSLGPPSAAARPTPRSQMWAPPPNPSSSTMGGGANGFRPPPSGPPSALPTWSAVESLQMPSQMWDSASSSSAGGVAHGARLSLGPLNGARPSLGPPSAETRMWPPPPPPPPNPSSSTTGGGANGFRPPPSGPPSALPSSSTSESPQPDDVWAPTLPPYDDTTKSGLPWKIPSPRLPMTVLTARRYSHLVGKMDSGGSTDSLDSLDSPQQLAFPTAPNSNSLVPTPSPPKFESRYHRDDDGAWRLDPAPSAVAAVPSTERAVHSPASSSTPPPQSSFKLDEAVAMAVLQSGRFPGLQGMPLAQLQEIMAGLLQIRPSATAAEAESSPSPGPVHRESMDKSVPSSQMMDLVGRISQGDRELPWVQASQQLEQQPVAGNGGGGGGAEQQRESPARTANVALSKLWSGASLPHSASAPERVGIPSSRSQAPSAPSPSQQPAAAARAGGARTPPELSPRQGFLHPQLTYQGVAEVRTELPVAQGVPKFSFI